jgi:hypothetical protein
LGVIFISPHLGVWLYLHQRSTSQIKASVWTGGHYSPWIH